MAISTPESWSLKPSFPKLDDPISIGIVRIKKELDISEAKKYGISLHNIIHTKNLAVWRIPARHIVWCTSVRNGFNLPQAIDIHQSTNGEKIKEWASDIITISKSKFEEASIEEKGRFVLQAKNPKVDSFIILVTWNASLCDQARKACIDGLSDQDSGVEMQDCIAAKNEVARSM